MGREDAVAADRKGGGVRKRAGPRRVSSRLVESKPDEAAVDVVVEDVVVVVAAVDVVVVAAVVDVVVAVEEMPSRPSFQ